jgi:predicted DNA-binding protein
MDKKQTSAHLKTKKGRVTASELAEAMEKAMEEMKELLEDLLAQEISKTQRLGPVMRHMPGGEPGICGPNCPRCSHYRTDELSVQITMPEELYERLKHTLYELRRPAHKTTKR